MSIFHELDKCCHIVCFLEFTPIVTPVLLLLFFPVVITVIFNLVIHRPMIVGLDLRGIFQIVPPIFVLRLAITK